jgi:hypothetical protein
VAKQEQKLREKAARFYRLFSTHDGEQVLQDLVEEFDADDLFHENPHKMGYNVGRRDVVIYIKQLMRYEDNARRTELEG